MFDFVKIVILVVVIFLSLFVIFTLFCKRNERNESFQSDTKSYNIGIVTLETRNLSFLDMHNQSLKAYSERHGYKYIFINEYTNNLKLPIYWQKLQIVKEMLSDYDYVIWMDSDTIVKHPEISLQPLIQQSNNADILIAKNYPGTKFQPYCAGIFVIKNSKVGHEFIEECIQTYISREECYNSDGDLDINGLFAGRCYEQGIMNELLKDKYKKYTYSIPGYFVINNNKSNHDTVILHHYGRNKKRTHDAFKSAYLSQN